jgi:poly-gamma-glutamate capsule biosynthesis protein CapA/YwtB (metallophosphatase superfamily)
MSASAELRSACPRRQQLLRVFLCGDVMTGRGIDQVLPHPCDPVLREGYLRSAMDYVRLAEETNGPFPRPVTSSYVWGAALDELNRMQTDARIINLETSITRSEGFTPKGINYRMSPENADCLAAAAIDCCVLANNHILDFGRHGLLDTLSTLERLRIKAAGAGRDFQQASAPALLNFAGKGRLLVYSFASVTSGTPRRWAATLEAAGVNLLDDLSEASAARISEQFARVRQPRDVIIVSVHWGANWGYEIPADQTRFAHALVDHANVSIVHGHSSHHAKAMEVYRNRLILYGCGDFLNDYEGIEGYEAYRDDLALMYFADINPLSKDVVALELVPLQIQRFQLVRPSKQDIDWVRQTVDRESQRFSTHLTLTSDGRLVLSWPGSGRCSEKTEGSQ